MGKDADFIRELLVAYNMRPSRAETLYDLANYYRLRGDNAASLVFSEAGLQIPKSTDALFVNDYVYEVGLAEEYSICAFYQESKRKNGFIVANHLAMKPGPYAGARQLARTNLFWYLPKITEFCPSFKSRKIDFEPPPEWTALNPSVTRVDSRMWCVVRTVNYKIDEWGRYLIRGTDGTANATNPINTRNYLLEFTDKLDTKLGIVNEIHAPADLPCEFPLVIGFEDMRVFGWKGDLWTSSTMRQVHPDGNCEQVLGRLGSHSPHGYEVMDVKRMLRLPRQTQKNWAPISTGDTLRFLYRPGHVVDIHGNDLVVHPTTGLDTGQISGGSQLIPFENGWLSIHHEAQYIPGRQIRHYFHRFMYHDADFRLTRVSLPFVFEDRQIEFCAGMCWHPDDDQLVISYGVRDSEARIATVSHREISRLLWIVSKESLPHGNRSSSA
jgi:hypothetical protein